MAVRLDKPWQPLPEALARLHGHLGVFQLADAGGRVIYIGFAGGRSRQGLKGEISAMMNEIPDAAAVRWEINTAYQSRFRELLWVHRADHGELPVSNVELGHLPAVIGRISPG